MHFGRGQAPNLAAEDEHCRHDQELGNSFKVLGVVLSLDMKHHDQVDKAMTKARSAAFLIRRLFRHLSPEVILRA